MYFWGSCLRRRICRHCSDAVTYRFKTFGRFEMAMAVSIPLQGSEMAWPFQNGHMIDLAVSKRPTIPLGRFDTSPD